MVYGPTMRRKLICCAAEVGNGRVPGGVRVAMVGGPVAALLLAQMERDPEGCKELVKGVGETAKV